MADRDLQELLTAGSEELEVEYKAWLDTSDAEVRAKLARHLAALSNLGGGYLIFGVDDASRVPQGATSLPKESFADDAISSIVKRYLDPPFQCRVSFVPYEGVDYPVVVVPSHGHRPVISVADGPSDGSRQPVGIRAGMLYIRAPGPESVAIRRPDDWNAILDRCLSQRADVLARIMRQAISNPAKASAAAGDSLRAACRATGDTFTAQMKKVAALVEQKDVERVRRMGDAHAVLGYALLNDDGDTIVYDDVRRLNLQADVGMHQYAYRGWSAFLPLHVPERAPQLRTETLDRDRTFLEGMLPEESVVLTTFDYWRMYEDGVGCFAEAYHEDYNTPELPYLAVGSCLVKLHSLLAHSRLVGERVPGVGRVLIHMDWRGISGRILFWRQGFVASPLKLRDDRFTKTIALDWRQLRDDYFECLRSVCLPFFKLYALDQTSAPETWLTRELVESEFARTDSRLRLFD